MKSEPLRQPVTRRYRPNDSAGRHAWINLRCTLPGRRRALGAALAHAGGSSLAGARRCSHRSGRHSCIPCLGPSTGARTGCCLLRLRLALAPVLPSGLDVLVETDAGQRAVQPDEGDALGVEQALQQIEHPTRQRQIGRLPAGFDDVGQQRGLTRGDRGVYSCASPGQPVRRMCRNVHVGARVVGATLPG